LTFRLWLLNQVGIRVGWEENPYTMQDIADLHALVVRAPPPKETEPFFLRAEVEVSLTTPTEEELDRREEWRTA